MGDCRAMSALALWRFALIIPSIAQMNVGGGNGFLRAGHDGHFVRLLQNSSDNDNVTDSDIPPTVGIGFVQPSDAADVVPTATDGELIEELEEDDRVTVISTQLSEVLCDSLENAEDAPRLQFNIGPDEVLIADQTSFTQFNGSIFADGVSRKVWTGGVEQDNGAITSQTTSMTWGEVCDVETFLLEIATIFSNGTIHVAKTIPCEAAGEFDICFVEFEIVLPDEGDPDVRDSDVDDPGDFRQLRDARAKNEDEFELDAKAGAITSVGRQLQSTTTQIDIMFFYTPSGRDILGVSDSQMQSELADALISSNEAMLNSDVDLQFSLVRVEPLPYIEGNISSSVVLENLETNSEVAELRNTFGADLVQLVTDLNADTIGGSCGLALLPSSPNEAFAFSVMDPYCFFQFTHTHEFGHNMGCYHNRENSFVQDEFAHAFRYCDGDLPYRTVLSFACFNNGVLVPRVNYFSNPDIIFNGRPTGTLVDDCARRLSETMGDVANYRESAATPAPTVPLMPAPTPAPTTPMPTPAPTPPMTPMPTLAPTTPTTPMPTLAPTTPTTPMPTPAPTTPTTPMPTLAPTTPTTPMPTPAPTTPKTPMPTPAPTTPKTPMPITSIIPGPTTDPTICSNGITGVERDEYCCTLGCGVCGGFGCSQRAREAGLTSGDCCVTRIEESGRFCDTLGTAPCIFGEGPSPAPITPEPTTPMTPAPTTPGPTTDPTICSNGITGVEREEYCCTLGCGVCGGFGCSQRAREAGLTSNDCCVARIAESGVFCDVSGTAPCILGGAPTPTPESAMPVPIILAIPPTAVSTTPEPSSLAPTPESPTPEPFTMTESMEVGERTTVVVTANGFDERTSGYGCSPDGCVAANTRDGSLDTRWSCKESLLGGVNCEITYEFGEPQDLDMIRIAFYKGAERTRKLKVKINGSTFTEIVSSGQTDGFEDFTLGADDASEVTFEGLELRSEDWISLTEVQFFVS